MESDYQILFFYILLVICSLLICATITKNRSKDYVYKVVYFIQNLFSRRSLAQHSRIFFKYYKLKRTLKLRHRSPYYLMIGK
jgi:hypothetical protein